MFAAAAPPPTVAGHRAATSDHRLSVGEDEEKREREERVGRTNLGEERERWDKMKGSLTRKPYL